MIFYPQTILGLIVDAEFDKIPHYPQTTYVVYPSPMQAAPCNGVESTPHSTTLVLSNMM